MGERGWRLKAAPKGVPPPGPSSGTPIPAWAQRLLVRRRPWRRNARQHGGWRYKQTFGTPGLGESAQADLVAVGP
jgi:hypothetical protein